MALILVSEKRSLCYSFLRTCTRIVKRIRRRYASAKMAVSIGVPGSTPTREGANSGTKSGGRSPDGLSGPQRHRASQDAGPTMGGGPMSTPDLHPTAAKVATMLAFHCVRNSYLEDLHTGIFPSSQTGDYTDVKVVSPYGEIAWNRLGRLSDEEMQRLSEDIVNRLYAFLFYLLTSGEPDRGMPLPKSWSPPRIEGSIAAMWPEGRNPASDVKPG